MRDAVSQSALAAAVAVAREYGVRVEDPVVLHDVFSVAVHLRPAPVVARIPTWVNRLKPGDPAVRQTAEIDVADFLVRQGVPVAGPSRELPPGPHRADGFSITYWTYAEPVREVTEADCVSMLGELHEGLRAYPGELPRLADLVLDMRWFDLLGNGADLLTEADIARLRTTADRLRPRLESVSYGPALHGDAHTGNMIATRDGLLWLDLEEVCRGPLEWDLACIGDTPDRPEHDPELLEFCNQVRTLQVTLCLIGIRDTFADVPKWDGYIRPLLQQLLA